MATRHALSLTSRRQGFAYGLFRAFVSWPNPNEAQKRRPNPALNPEVIYLSAFERAMQDLHGDQWKRRLNGRQRQFVSAREHRRACYQEKLRAEYREKQTGEQTGVQLVRPARDDEYPPEWHTKVEQFKTLFKEQEARDARGKAVSKPEQPESQA